VFPADVLASTFPSKTLGTTLFAFREIPSTNSFALERIRNNPAHGTLIVADHQTAGRGRMSRNWFSPPEVNLYGSLLIRSTLPGRYAGWIPLISGLIVGKTIEETTGIRIDLKWPNDLLIQEKKVGGILCETALGVDGSPWVVIGFGINVNLPENHFPDELRMTMTSLHQVSGHPWDRLSLLQNIAGSLEGVWTGQDWPALSRLKKPYSDSCSTLGQMVQVHYPDGSLVIGMAAFIGEEGQLQLIPSSSFQPGQSDRILAVHSGDILHVRKGHIHDG
jgi:BirA family transcriptional regulator, biotin operon repressor / biotin---[acetyl-CoA-carboxylase] ligase